MRPQIEAAHRLRAPIDQELAHYREYYPPEAGWQVNAKFGGQVIEITPPDPRIKLELGTRARRALSLPYGW